jgi:putative ABC transport system substrate-binding protein
MSIQQMQRRAFIAALGSSAAWPLVARPQQPMKVIRVGVLASTPLPPLERFAHKLGEYGYVEGQNVRFEARFAEGHDERYLAMAEELAAIPVDLIVTWGTPATLAAKHATKTIPIVMGSVADPVSAGIVTSLARPEGNITGFSALNVDLEGKRLELLKYLLPGITHVAILGNNTNPFLDIAMQRVRPEASTMGIALELFEVRTKDDVDGALVRLDQARPDAVQIVADTLLLTKRREITAALANSKLPAVYPFREYAEVGGLMVHGANFGILFERAAGYAERILKGARPSDLPVQLATEFELIINLKTAKALGLTVPPSLLARADEVIE